jgi:hypothetical protein
MGANVHIGCVPETVEKIFFPHVEAIGDGEPVEGRDGRFARLSRVTGGE